MSTMKLFTDVGNFRAFKILIAAEYNGIDIEIPDFELGKDNKTADFLKKSPLGRVPVLETPSGSIFEANAIARYVARIRRDTELFGTSFFESAQVDSWIDFCAHDIELPATIWIYPIIGLLPYNAAACAKAKVDLAKALGMLEAHLVDKTYLVGHKITLADITVATTLVYPFKFVCDASFRAPFPNVVRWFVTCVNQPAFINVVGNVVLAEVELTPENVASTPAPAASKGKSEAKPAQDKQPKKEKTEKPKEEKPKAEKPKKEDKPKEEKPKEEKPKESKKKAKEEDDDEPEPDVPVEKKAEHPFRILDRTNPSPFVMDNWKRNYSNCSDYKVAMEEFWQQFDPAGWSIFRGDYNYNDELKVLFMTSNLIGGFIQRTEEIRKWLFGTMTIRGEEGKSLKVTCYYLIRGDSIQPLIDCNDDASCYTWTKVNVPVSEADKQTLYDYWCSEGPLDGEPCLDSRAYK